MSKQTPGEQQQYSNVHNQNFIQFNCARVKEGGFVVVGNIYPRVMIY